MADEIMNEDSGSEDEVLKRLLELKELYKSQNDELSGEGTSSEDSVGESKPKSRVKRLRGKPRPEPRLSALQTVILQTVEEHGGLCHAETIVEYVRLKWPELRGRDSSLYAASDCRKIVNASLRALDLVNQHEQEGYWCINENWDDGENGGDARVSSDDEADLLLDLENEIGKPVPMTNFITKAMEARDGGSYLDDICDYVLRKWERPQKCSGLTDEEIKESIQVVLRTDPKYQRDPSNPDLYILSNDHKLARSKKQANPAPRQRPSPTSIVPRAPSPPPSVANKVPNRSRSNSLNKRPSPSSAPSTPPNTAPIAQPSIPATPPHGYVCLCGAVEPGGKGKWHTSQGQWLCQPCGSKWSKKSSCPMCGKLYRNPDAKYAIENAWICCDDCHRWVMAKCDGIEDLSIYDDANPNHIHYACPIKIRHEEEKNRPQVEGEYYFHSPRRMFKDLSPTPQTTPLIIKPIHAIVPIQATHIQPIQIAKPPSPTSSSPPHNAPLSSVPTLSSRNAPIPPVVRQPIQIAPVTVTRPLISRLSFSAELALAAANLQQRRDEIDALVSIGVPVTKIDAPIRIATQPVGVHLAKSPPPIKALELSKLRANKPVKKRARTEDALVPSQETAEILSSMPWSNPSPRSFTTPSAISPRTLSSIKPTSQKSSVLSSSPAPPSHFDQVQPQQSPILPQFTHLQLHSPAPSPQAQPSPQFGTIQPAFQPTQILSHLTQLGQILSLPAQSLNTTAPMQTTQLNFPQDPFSKFSSSIPVVSTCTPIKYERPAIGTDISITPVVVDVINFEKNATSVSKVTPISSPRNNTAVTNDELMDQAGSNLEEDLRIFKESLEQEHKTNPHLLQRNHVETH